MPHATIDDALALATKHFYGVKDEDGEPYILHCLRVMMNAKDPQAQQVALLHDLVEDTAVTLDELRNAGFSADVVQAIDLITHRESDSYADYVIQLSENRLARDAKLADLQDNSSLKRVLLREASLQADTAQVQRYILSFQFLSGRLDIEAYRRRMLPIDSVSSQTLEE